ncbi:MAG: hypothetical protein ACI841_004538 [Planctomycetota bacterium]|jgi:hypothetical protein
MRISHSLSLPLFACIATIVGLTVCGDDAALGAAEAEDRQAAYNASGVDVESSDLTERVGSQWEVATHKRTQVSLLQEVEDQREPTSEASGAFLDVPLPKEEGDGIWGEIEAPDDPVKMGTCSIHMSFVDALTQQAVASTAWLYRLDAPANDNCSRGDQLQTTVDVPVEGHWFSLLRKGRYGLVPTAMARSGEQLPEFEVVEDRSRERFELAVAQERTAWLRVHDGYRDWLDTLRVARLPARQSWTSDVYAPWRKHRDMLAANGYLTDSEIETMSETLFDSLDFRDVESEEAGFALGPASESKSQARIEHRFDARLPESNHILRELRLESRERMELVAAIVLMNEVFDRILLPDGRRGQDVIEHVEVISHARNVRASFHLDCWLQSTLDIRVTVPGYEKMSYEWQLSTGGLTAIVLESL